MEVITTHVNADFDAMGSMIAAKKLYPDAVLVFPGSQERTLREFFVKSTVYIYDFKRLRDVDLAQVERLILVDTRQLSPVNTWISTSTTIIRTRKTTSEARSWKLGPLGRR